MRRTLSVFLTALVLVTGAAVAGGPRAAQADHWRFPHHGASGPVYVVDKTGWGWPVRKEVNYFDRFTGSRLILRNSCVTGKRCLIFRQAWIGSYANTNPYTYPTVTITVNHNQRYRYWYQKRRILRHEMGHAFGLFNGGWRTVKRDHRPQCANIMYWAVPDRCWNGRTSGYNGFTKWQKSVLQRY